MKTAWLGYIEDEALVQAPAEFVMVETVFEWMRHKLPFPAMA